MSQLLTLPHGRPATTAVPAPNVALYQNGRNTPFASCLVIWQACHLMTQRPYHAWREDNGFLVWEYQGPSGRLRYRLPRADWEQRDMRVVTMHLLLAACATQKSRPWEEALVLNDRLVAEFLGWPQRKDLNRLRKLLLIEAWMRQAAALEVEVSWQRRGQIPAVHLPFAPLWRITPTYHIATAKDGSTYLSGLSFQVFAGPWATYFLNREQARQKTAYYQYGWLPRSLAPQVMHLWKRHPGAVVLLLYFLFQLRLRREPQTKVATLLKLVYGDTLLQSAWHQANLRRQLMAGFEADLAPLFDYGFRPLLAEPFYPRALWPWWASAQEVPDDPEEALEYWMTQAPAPKTNSKQKWVQLVNAAVQVTAFPADWPAKAPPKERSTQPNLPTPAGLTGTFVKQARLQKRLSQRQLCALLNKSQSWLRDIESGRYRLKPQDMALLQTVLNQLPDPASAGAGLG
ncbi:MAG: helix-turn-helix transcriptional regulator [Gloeomargarita sp. SKYBB_i_bin120]|nr:helix-turn-helix domain-containing protein [Gloeomargarita sp. SKYG98]MCS7292684.1 helix-turn-helix domain-containing protein [Gloeomargarita sp. SKYB120]MDW8178246.1 helix-turn-helix transcriptional regulator [Gloeomargarita sp. SKYBB_i_bin120]